MGTGSGQAVSESHPLCPADAVPVLARHRLLIHEADILPREGELYVSLPRFQEGPQNLSLRFYSPLFII